MAAGVAASAGAAPLPVPSSRIQYETSGESARRAERERLEAEEEAERSAKASADRSRRQAEDAAKRDAEEAEDRSRRQAEFAKEQEVEQGVRALTGQRVSIEEEQDGIRRQLQDISERPGLTPDEIDRETAALTERFEELNRRNEEIESDIAKLRRSLDTI